MTVALATRTAIPIEAGSPAEPSRIKGAMSAGLLSTVRDARTLTEEGYGFAGGGKASVLKTARSG